MTDTSYAIAETKAAAREPSGRRAGGPAAVLMFAALVVIAGVVLIPILATALDGFKQLGDLQANPFGLPRVWIWKNYWDILTGARYWQVLGNSLLIALLTVALTLAVSSMAAFTFAHLRFFGDRFLLSYLQLGLLFPVATAIPPLFIKIRDLGLLDSYWGVVLPQVAFSLLCLHYAAAVRADPVDRRRHLLRRQLERLSPAARRSQQRIAISVDSWPDGLPGPVLDLLAARARLHHAHDPACDRDVSDGAALHRRGADRGRGQGLTARFQPDSRRGGFSNFKIAEPKHQKDDDEPADDRREEHEIAEAARPLEKVGVVAEGERAVVKCIVNEPDWRAKRDRSDARHDPDDQRQQAEDEQTDSPLLMPRRSGGDEVGPVFQCQRAHAGFRQNGHPG